MPDKVDKCPRCGCAVDYVIGFFYLCPICDEFEDNSNEPTDDMWPFGDITIKDGEPEWQSDTSAPSDMRDYWNWAIPDNID